MRKGVIVSLIVVLGLVFVSAVYAYFPASGSGACLLRFDRTGSEDFQKFQKEILPLRNELMSKKIELRREFNKAGLDRDRIAQIQKEIIDIRAEMLKKSDGAGPHAWEKRMRVCDTTGNGMLHRKCPRPMAF